MTYLLLQQREISRLAVLRIPELGELGLPSEGQNNTELFSSLVCQTTDVLVIWGNSLGPFHLL